MKINTVYCVRIYIGSFSWTRRGEDMRDEKEGGKRDQWDKSRTYEKNEFFAKRKEISLKC
jgi:hypothetical protein